VTASSSAQEESDRPSSICGGFAWCQVSPRITDASAELVQEPNGGRDIVFNVPYDVPNNYCQVNVDDTMPACGPGIWPPTNVLSIPAVRLMIVDGDTHEILVTAPAIFEAGVWKPRLNGGCGGSTKTYRIIATNTGEGSPGCGPNPTFETDLTVDVPAPDGDCNPARCAPRAVARAIRPHRAAAVPSASARATSRSPRGSFPSTNNP